MKAGGTQTAKGQAPPHGRKTGRVIDILFAKRGNSTRWTRARIVLAAILVTIGHFITLAWFALIVPNLERMLASPYMQDLYVYIVAVPLGVASAFLILGGLRGVRAVHGLAPRGRWLGRAIFGGSLVFGLLVVAAGGVLLTAI